MTTARLIAVGSAPTFKQQVARALEIDPEQVDWLSSVTAAEDSISGAGQSAAVVVVAPEVKEADVFGLAAFTARFAPATAIVMIREHADPGTLTAAMRAGVRDVVDMSRGANEMRDALERAVSWSDSLRASAGGGPSESTMGTGKIVSVFSSKGGSGKTFLACNLAVALAERSSRPTAVIDLDLDMGDVFSYFGTEPKNQIEDMIALGDKLEPETLLSSGTPLGDNLWGYGATPNPTASPVPGGAIGKLLRGIRNTFAYSVVDATADYSDEALAAFDASDEIFLVAMMDVVGVRHLSKALETLLSIGIPRERFRIVLNRADSKVGLSSDDVERVLKIEINGLIPSSRLVPISLNKGHPLYRDEPRSSVAETIRQLADAVIGTDLLLDQPEHPTKRRLFGRG